MHTGIVQVGPLGIGHGPLPERGNRGPDLRIKSAFPALACFDTEGIDRGRQSESGGSDERMRAPAEVIITPRKPRWM